MQQPVGSDELRAGVIPDLVGWDRVRDALGVIPGPDGSSIDLSGCVATHVTSRTELPDSAEKYVVKANASAKHPLCVIKISSAIDPQSEAHSITLARKFASAIGEPGSQHVVAPIHAGEIDGRSFGAYNWLEALVTTNPGWLLQRKRLMPHVTQWLEEVTRLTARGCNDDELSRLFVNPLERVVADGSELGADYQRVAKRALTRIQRNEFQPVLCAMHGDPSRNNIMLDRKNVSGFSKGSTVSRFKFIDWSGSSVDGYPFYDLIRTGNTFRASIPQQLKTHMDLVSCSTEDVSAYITAALGNLRDNLRYCPRHVFALSAQKYLADLADSDLL